MYICDFWRSDGAGSATTRNTRGLTRSVIALIVPPFPAPSRPSNTMQILSPLYFTHSWSFTSSTWSLDSSLSYFLRLTFPPSSSPESPRFAAFLSLAMFLLLMISTMVTRGARQRASRLGYDNFEWWRRSSQKSMGPWCYPPPGIEPIVIIPPLRLPVARGGAPPAPDSPRCRKYRR